MSMPNGSNRDILNSDEKKTDIELKKCLKTEHQMLKEEKTDVTISSGMERYR